MDEFTVDQQRAIERAVSAKLAGEHRIHRREFAAQEAVLRAEIARLELELRTAHGVVTRIRNLLTDSES